VEAVEACIPVASDDGLSTGEIIAIVLVCLVVVVIVVLIILVCYYKKRRNQPPKRERKETTIYGETTYDNANDLSGIPTVDRGVIPPALPPPRAHSRRLPNQQDMDREKKFSDTSITTYQSLGSIYGDNEGYTAPSANSVDSGIGIENGVQIDGRFDPNVTYDNREASPIYNPGEEYGYSKIDRQNTPTKSPNRSASSGVYQIHNTASSYLTIVGEDEDKNTYM